ncbi:MAG: sugar phosphate isomerase/epimerase [Clostridia bacterium]|nr:sugar phosphate isomerase/epimerase [Clostridia bacterium]
MKIGICYSIWKIDEAAAMGADYIEGNCTVTSELSEEDFEKLCAITDASPIKFEAFNCLFPGEIRLTGPEFDPAKVEAYARHVFPRLARLGARSVVFGSGKSRKVPDDFDRAIAWHQLITVGRIIGSVARENGLVIALEPLNTGETNIINSQAEGMRLVKDVADDNFRILTDSFHLYKGNENGDAVAACGEYLTHIHVSNPTTRSYPVEGDGEDYADFFDGIRRAGYDARVSYEGNTREPEALPAALAYIRKLANI